MKIHTQAIENLYFDRAKPILESKIRYPELEGKLRRDAEERFNRTYEQNARLRNRTVRDTLLPQAKREAAQAAEEGFPFQMQSYIRTFEVTRLSLPYVSLYFDTYRYTGGTHGMTERTGNTWDMRKGTTVPLSHFIRQDTQTEILRRIRAVIGEQDRDWFDDAEQVAVTQFDPKRYYLTDSSFLFFYPLYMLAPYSEGIPTFEIPFSDLNIRDLR